MMPIARIYRGRMVSAEFQFQIGSAIRSVRRRLRCSFTALIFSRHSLSFLICLSMLSYFALDRRSWARRRARFVFDKTPFNFLLCVCSSHSPFPSSEAAGGRVLPNNQFKSRPINHSPISITASVSSFNVSFKASASSWYFCESLSDFSISLS